MASLVPHPLNAVAPCYAGSRSPRSLTVLYKLFYHSFSFGVACCLGLLYISYEGLQGLGFDSYSRRRWQYLKLMSLWVLEDRGVVIQRGMCQRARVRPGIVFRT